MRLISRFHHPASLGCRLFSNAVVESALNGTCPANHLTGEIAILELEWGQVVREVLVALRWSGIEERDPQPGFRQALAGSVAGGSGADYDCSKRLLGRIRHWVE